MVNSSGLREGGSSKFASINNAFIYCPSVKNEGQYISIIVDKRLHVYALNLWLCNRFVGLSIN